MTILCHLGKIINYKCQCGKTLANKNIKEGLMKKFLKFGAALTALVLGLACFAACSNDDGGESRSVVAEYQDTELEPYAYIFYSDGTYEFTASQQVKEKGIYSGSPAKRGTVTMQRQYSFDTVSGGLISDVGNYKIIIDKNDDGDLYFKDDEGYSYFLN